MKLLLTLCLSSMILAVSGIMALGQSYDRYGGRLDLHFDDGTGYFRLGEMGGKHFLITPEGNAFRSIGINHTHMTQSTDYNVIIEDLRSMGFNSGDYQGPKWMWDRIPYTKGVNLLSTSIWLPEEKFKFEDVFDPVFLSALEDKIKGIVLPQAENKMLIAYFLTDVPVWSTEKYGQGWIDFFRALDNSAPGKIEWDTWKAANPDAPEEEFIPRIARQVYSKGTALIRKYDNNHLIFSDRYLEHYFSVEAAREVLPYVDGIATQPKNILSLDYFQTLFEELGKPLFIADHVSSYATEEYPNTMGQVTDNVDDYEDFYRNSVFDVMSLPYVVGFNKCQYMDEVKGPILKQGLYRSNGEPYEYLDGLKEAHTRALEKAYSLDVENPAQKLLDWGAYENTKLEAIDRIEQYRKGEKRLKVFFPNLDTAVNTNVQLKLKRHDFLWGAVIRESFETSPYSETYKKNFLKYFNATGFGIEMKPKWRDHPMEETSVNIIMPWLLDRDVYVRGHTLAWEGVNYMRPEDQAIYNNATLSDQEKGDSLLNSMGFHFSHAIPRWGAKCWDVSNESITNNAVNDLLPDLNTHVHWFKLADSIRRQHGKEDVKLFQNDYQIISAISSWALNYTKDGYSSVGRPALYREIMDEQIALGAPIEGIGFQSRLKHGLISPDSVYKRLTDFERFNLPYHATEFEIRDDASKYVYSDDERRLLTEYMMVMNFSHPNVEGFWHWTFAEVRDNVSWDYALFNFDGSPKVNGQIWMDLMDGFFNIDKNSTTDGRGEVDVRGYYGNYEIFAESGGEVWLGHFRIDSTDTDSIIPVYLDRGFSLSGLEDSAAYELNQQLNIEISAFSNVGDITSIELELNKNSLGSDSDSTFVLNYTPSTTDEGWNEFNVIVIGDQGYTFSHIIDVYFGNTDPIIEIEGQPGDTIIAGSTGNQITFSTSGTYASINSVMLSYSGNDFSLGNSSGTYAFNLDTLESGHYQLIIQVRDDKGGVATDTVSFTVKLPQNILPHIEITAPEDSSVMLYGENIVLIIDASDSDGTLSKIEIFLNNALSQTLYKSPYSVPLDTLSTGDYEIIAIATDDRGGQTSDTIFVHVQDHASSSGHLNVSSSGILAYPNPVSDMLYFTRRCDFEICTLPGKKLLEGEGALQVNVSTLKQGMYLVKTSNGVFKLRKD